MKRSGLKFIFAGILLMVVIPFMNQAAGAVTSTFDSDLEGWTGTGANLSWAAAEGIPLGSLCSDDPGPVWAQAVAPAKFFGPWPGAGTVSADIKNLNSSDNFPAFAISDGNTSYEYVFSTVATDTWQTFSASLTDPLWNRITGSGDWGTFDWNPPIGNEDLATVLQNITAFHIRTDLHNGPDAVYLDNIKVVPIPAALPLMGSGLLGLVAMAWRRLWK